MNKSKRFAFSGHDSFQCRLMWLKKGYDFLQAGHSFSDDMAAIILGVGNNMVRSIRFWMRAFGLTDEKDNITEYAAVVFGIDADVDTSDPFLEDEATLWILHYHLVSGGYASTYSLMFNEFRKSKIEFTKTDYLNYVKLKLEERSQTVSDNSILEDFVVMVKMYLGSDNSKDKEDSFSGILTELNLLSYYVKQKDDSKKESENVYYISPSEREEIPEIAILYAILDNNRYHNSVSLNQLDVEEDGPGSIFAITKEGLSNKVKRLAKDYDFITINEQAGVREVQFKDKPSSVQVLKEYYISQEKYESI